MLAILIAMIVIVVVAGLIVTYVAFPHRGEDVPGAPWLGDAMTKGVEALPHLDEEEHVNPFSSRADDPVTGQAEGRPDARPDARPDGRGDEPGPRHAL